MEWIDVKLHPELADATHRLARERDVTVGQLVRDLLAKEISKGKLARPPVRAEEQLVAPLRARLADDLAYARSWEELDLRLKAKGYKLVAAGGGLALHQRSTGRRMCKASELGFSYSKLASRIGAPFPGHPHAYLAQKFTNIPMQGTVHTPRPSASAHTRDITDDFDVIEPF
ncbi:MAG: hypothetical protein AAF590_13420 [Pseudomonadota bacterium]